jgi:hypothetical protein
MIISHEHQFIFIKTKKTAGTSIEIALSKICGDEDIITPILPEDESIRTALGYRGPQNYIFSGSQLFYNHIPACDIHALVGDDVWNTYFTFCFERNPWDKVISWYFFRHQTEPRPSISEFIRSAETGSFGNPGGFDLYSISGHIAVDRVCLYEHINEEIEYIQNLLNLPDIPALPTAKSRFRRDRRSYREVLGNEDRSAVERLFAREIAHFGYAF